MTNIEYAIIDELYFVISFKELLAQLDFDKELLENELRKLYQKGWIRIYDGIDKELEKLTHSLGPGTEISPAIIEEYIGYSKDFNSFELQNALGQRHLALCYRIVKYMGNNPAQHPFPLTISVVFNFFQKLFMYQGLKNPADAPRVLGISPYFVKDYQAAAQKYSMRQTAKVLQLLKIYDLKSKGVGANNAPLEELMKEMVLKIVSV